MRITYVISFEALKIIPDTLQELKMSIIIVADKKRTISLINPIKDFVIVNITNLGKPYISHMLKSHEGNNLFLHV